MSYKNPTTITIDNDSKSQIDLIEFQLEILKLIGITNKNIKTEEEKISRLKKLSEEKGFFTPADEENPFQLIPISEATIERYKEAVRTYEAVLDVAKRIAY